MALTTVVKSQLYERLVEATRKISAKNGDFRLVMLLPSNDSSSESWNLVFSSSWLDPLGIGSAIKNLLDALKSLLSPDDIAKIRRVSVLRTSEPLVRELTSEVSIDLGTVLRVQSSAMSRFGIAEGIVLVSQPPTSPQGLNKPVVHTSSR